MAATAERLTRRRIDDKPEIPALAMVIAGISG